MNLNISKLLNKPPQFYLGLILLLLVIFYRPKNKEGFLNPGEYTRETVYPLLYGEYPLKKKNYKQVSANNYSDNYEYYPIYPADSLKINNVRYWKAPDNGLCSTAEFCDVLYDEKQMPEHNLYPPEPEWGPSRVNYYEGKHIDLIEDISTTE